MKEGVVEDFVLAPVADMLTGVYRPTGSWGVGLQEERVVVVMNVESIVKLPIVKARERMDR